MVRLFLIKEISGFILFEKRDLFSNEIRIMSNFFR